MTVLLFPSTVTPTALTDIQYQNTSTWQGLFAFAVSVGAISQPTAQAEKVELTRSQWFPNGLYS